MLRASHSTMTCTRINTLAAFVRAFTALVFSLLLALSSLTFAADDVKLLQTQLDNGLTVIIKPDHRSPVVVTTVWYKVGGSYENDGITGISHVLEHLMFQGTKAEPPGQFLKKITDNGGEYNAVTTDDYTKYYELMSADKLPLILKLEADRMHNLVLSDKSVRKELNVVKEERRMRVDDNPMGQTYERFMATAFVNSPYHHPVVGWQTDLNAMSVKDIRRWYTDWYQPNNAAIVIVGDVDANKALSQVKRYFTWIPRHEVPKVKPRVEVASLGEKSIDVNLPAQTPWLIMGYQTPSLVTMNESSQAWQNYSLLVANEILTGSDSARLSKRLVRGQQVAAGADGDYDLLSLHKGLFGVYALPTPDHSVDELKQAITEQIHQLQTQPVDKKELSRVKAQVVASKVYQQDSIMSQANELGVYWVVGLPIELANEFVRAVSDVKPEQVMAVAKRYLNSSNLTSAVLVPKPESQQGAP